MRGKRKLHKVEGMSNEDTHTYKCDACAWSLDVPSGLSMTEIETEFAVHDCKEERAEENGRRPRPVKAIVPRFEAIAE